MEKAYLRTSAHTRSWLFSLRAGRVLFSPSVTHSCNHRQTVFQEAIHSALFLQTFCFAPARGHDPKHLRIMPARVQRLRRGTDLVPQVRHSHCSASLPPLSSWLTDEDCHGSGRQKWSQGHLETSYVENLTLSLILATQIFSGFPF